MSTTLKNEPIFRIGIQKQAHLRDARAEQVLRAIREFLGLNVSVVKIRHLYTIRKQLSDEQVAKIASGPLLDPICEEAVVDLKHNQECDWMIEIRLKKGMTDNAGMTAQTTIEDFLGAPFAEKENVYAATQYLLRGAISYDDACRIANELLGNPLIEDILVQSAARAAIHPSVAIIDINLPDDDLLQISIDRQLALNLQEMQAIRAHYANASVANIRAAYGLPDQPTDVELECLAQTWSEHCKHKIFNATILYSEGTERREINSLFQSCIKKATETIAPGIDWLVSVFSDNAGIIRFNSTYNLAFKVETHNSPSALDPYGGALTGILGVNRDILGAGSGARLMANTDVFCFAPPDYKGSIPKRLHHPKRIFEGVRRGVEHGGNKSGVPTVNGAVVFDERYLGKPLVYCGTVGIMPAEIDRHLTHEKHILPGDLIIIAGGRTGKDGIHGATFSSEELHETSPSSAVQIGDPFTQKKLHDFLLEARDRRLFRTLTDNGAGGFSSSIGELSDLSGGCEVHLDRVPLKNHQLQPWEIFLSESQERMTLAVPRQHVDALQELAAIHEVEIAQVGTFTDSGNVHVLHQGRTVALLPLVFLHDGIPQMTLEAEWCASPAAPLTLPRIDNYSVEIAAVLGRYNVCSKEGIIRQYDHEIQGGSTIKPLMGVDNDGPMDAAVVRPLECLIGSKEAVVISNGICPKFSAYDTYHMAASALDEAVRNCVAVGGNPDYLAVLDNFCWPDPVYHSQKTPDGKYKLAQLVRACQALYDCCTLFGTPIISGKDSMKNDYKIGEVKISVPPTLLISAISKMDNVELAVSSDVKCPGDLVYVLGTTYNELGGSEFSALHQLSGGAVPEVHPEKARSLYQKVHQAILRQSIASCHDCSDGGLAAALAESAFSGGLGMTVHLTAVPAEDCVHDAELLFSESNSRFVVTIAPDKKEEFELLMRGTACCCVGEVRADSQLCIIGLNNTALVNHPLSLFKKSWQDTLGGLQ